ncbi:hypothetical protein AcW1_003723 [Taiwanofungus camphoratus]|nr:hypothetical protein AcW1_003723 [Antrodia cinnamomea]
MNCCILSTHSERSKSKSFSSGILRRDGNCISSISTSSSDIRMNPSTIPSNSMSLDSLRQPARKCLLHNQAKSDSALVQLRSHLCLCLCLFLRQALDHFQEEGQGLEIFQNVVASVPWLLTEDVHPEDAISVPLLLMLSWHKQTGDE